MFTALGTGIGSFCSKFLPCESDKLKEMMLRSPHLGAATVFQVVAGCGLQFLCVRLQSRLMFNESLF